MTKGVVVSILFLSIIDTIFICTIIMLTFRYHGYAIVKGDSGALIFPLISSVPLMSVMLASVSDTAPRALRYPLNGLLVSSHLFVAIQGLVIIVLSLPLYIFKKEYFAFGFAIGLFQAGAIPLYMAGISVGIIMFIVKYIAGIINKSERHSSE